MIRFLLAVAILFVCVEGAEAAHRPVRQCIGGACKKVMAVRPIKRIFRAHR